ncbi:citron Rho-interacting kinase [Onthophagus taurus]|uniref:citron Rho-interacting kinase n=1 Tax=Onthophagus taurus TaxID=166361 RepID=UPI0039BEAFEA
MMEPSKEPINVRTKRIINHIIGNASSVEETLSLLTREGLLDVLDVLYEECSSECLKNADKNIKKFVERHKKTIGVLKKLRVNLSDFEIKNVIGRGHFGEVHVVKEKQTGHIYAMKTIKKHKSLEAKNASFEVERNIMAFSTSPWLTSLQYAFQDVANLYFIMDYHPGGDLVGLLYRQGGTLPESAARFYIAELVVALNDLHEMGYVHRDIKPDNILLDRCGHVKIVDFGSAALLNSKGEMSDVVPVGTPDYIAPEILQSFDNRTKKTYGISCDYWSLGVLGYELTVGNTPFNGSNTTVTYSKIMNHQTSLKFPPDIILTQGFVALIRNLLTDEDHRLTYEGILKHPVYKNVDFDSLRDQVPPYVPKISSIDDTSNFIDVAKTKNEPHIDHFKKKTQFSGRNLPFIGFTYTPFVEINNEGLTKCIVKDETITTLKKEIEKLQKKLMQVSDFGEKENFERKLDEKSRKLESIENVRKNLEKDLAKTIAECSALKRKLDLERKDRSEVEKKALELIKASKLKWEAAEKPKMEALEVELINYKEKVAKIEIENKNLIDQINQVALLENKHKVSLEKVENLRRSSVVGLETRLQKLTHQSQKELNELQTKLMEENQKNIDYEKVLNELKAINAQLKKEINKKSEELEEFKKKIVESNLKDQKVANKEFQKSIDGYKKEIEIYKDEINELKSKIINKDFLESKIKFEQEINEKFKQQIEDLKTELNFEKLSNKSSQEEVNSNFKLQIRALEVKIRDALAEKNDFHCKLKEAESKEEDHKRKINALESLVKELERGVGELEVTSDKQSILQKQVERLEQQLVETHEQFALEKQELSQLKSKYWRMERELQNSNLDKKIIERDYKEAKDQNNQLTQDIEAMILKINETKTTHERALLELNGLNENLTTEVIKLSELVKNLEDKLSVQREKSDGEKDAFNDLRADLRKRDEEIRQLRNEISEVKSEKNQWERRVFEITKQNEFINVKINKECNEKNILMKEIEDLKRKINNSQQNQNALREACSLLETQLEEFEHLYQVSESKRTSLISEVEKLNFELSTTRNEVQEAKRSINEEKSLRLLAETKLKKLIEDVESLQQELESYREECADFKTYSSGLANELTAAEQKITDLDVELKDCKRRLENYLAENVIIKEENSSQLTYLNNLKESNFKLSQNLNEYKTVNKTVIDQVNSLETLLSEKEMCFKERQIKMDATINQQIKLIDYLQSKIEEKKKKTLTDKLFGGSKKENHPPPSIVLNYKDLEHQLFKEKETNKNLQEEIIKLKSITLPNLNLNKLDSKMNIKDQKRLLEQIVQSPQKNDLYRQNSVQRMQHNIPHRFESKLCTKSIVCGQCGDSVQIGRGSSVCRECLIQVHSGCAKNVPRTCGLPQGFAKHYSDSLSRLKTKKEFDGNNEQIEDEDDGNVVFDVEGYVKVPVKSSWEKYYACLTSKSLTIYEEPPNTTSTKIVDKLKLNQLGTHGKVTLEPVESEIGISVANSDLPFVIKVEISPETTCWPPKNIIFMTLSVEDKDKWYKALDRLFNSPNGKYDGDVVLKLQEEIEVNCLIEFGDDLKLLGSDRGLFSFKNETLSHISGPLHIQQITSIQKLNLIVMIVDENRVLITCDYKHVQNLSLCAPCSKPTLQFNTINVKNIDGFHIFSVSTKKDLLCAATARQIIIMFYDSKLREYIPERILDTAEPTSCILFTEYTVLIGADKFFEIDLNNYEVDEFLDSSDRNLSLAIGCYKLKSFPLAILEVSKHPVEYLLCYNEFAIFVDEYGRNSRKNEIKFNHLPSAFYFISNHLFVVQFCAVEIIKIPSTSNQDDDNVDFERVKIDLASPKYLGSSKKGIYVKNQNLIKLICCKDDLVSDLDASTDSDAFSFTSSMVRSLDGHLSDDEDRFENEKRVKFARTTDL